MDDVFGTHSQMTCDLRRLRLAGLIRRIGHTNRYVLTPDGTAMAVFCTKLHNRLLRPLMAARQPQAPPPLRDALRTIDQHVDDYINRARLGKPRENLTQTYRSLGPRIASLFLSLTGLSVTKVAEYRDSQEPSG